MDAPAFAIFASRSPTSWDCYPPDSRATALSRTIRIWSRRISTQCSLLLFANRYCGFFDSSGGAAYSAASLVLPRFGFLAFFSTGSKNFPV